MAGQSPVDIPFRPDIIVESDKERTGAIILRSIGGDSPLLIGGYINLCIGIF